MNEVFSFSRFRRLFVKHTAEHYRTYLMSIAVLTGVFLLGGSFVFYLIPDPPDVGFQAAIFVTLGLVAGTIFTSTVFSDYGEKKKAVPALTLPATALEKFLVGWLYSYPIFILVYIGVFYVALYGLSSFRHWGGNQRFYVLNLRQSGMDIVLIMYSILHSLSLFGAIFFRKLHFIKSGFAFFIALAVLILLNTVLLRIMTGAEPVRLAVPFTVLEIVQPHRYYALSLNDPGIERMTLDLLMLMTVLVWIAAYFRLKEKQV